MTDYQWTPSGVDPTDLDYEMPRPHLAGCFSKIMKWIMIGFAAFGFWRLYQDSQQYAAARTITPTAIYTTSPAMTPTPVFVVITATISITRSPLPTVQAINQVVTPRATIPPLPTVTPPSGALATWTPGAWMLTRFASTYQAIYATGTPNENRPLPTSAR
jgi:hypothetical protein